MHRARWERFLPLLERYQIKPILAVIPENRDGELEIDSPDPEFWNQMRILKAAGATIGLHGYQHLCQSKGRSLIPIHAVTEFAGAEEGKQREWLSKGMAILRREGLQTRMFVAPRHGFDRTTLRLLRENGVEWISDGFAFAPFSEDGLIWIPQQLWGPQEKPNGLWTICLHANTATDEQVGELEAFLERFEAQFTSVQQVVAEWPIGGRSIRDRIFHRYLIARIRLTRICRRLGIR
jgi:peptidoglycan/xylan/chitin deacetylase (PgdA/CDA1 family)